jgi:hypothetical protein
VCHIVKVVKRSQRSRWQPCSSPKYHPFQRWCDLYMRDGQQPELRPSALAAHVAQISRGNAQANAVNSTDLAWSRLVRDQEVGRGVTSMKLRARSVREEAAEQSFRTKANLVTSLGRVPDLPGSFKTPENARSETARILFRASGPVCFQVFRSIVHGYASRGPTTQHRIFSRSLRDRWRELASRVGNVGFVTDVTFFGHFRCP